MIVSAFNKPAAIEASQNGVARRHYARPGMTIAEAVTLRFSPLRRDVLVNIAPRQPSALDFVGKSQRRLSVLRDRTFRLSEMAAVQKYALALFGQSALSDFNFALNVLLVRHLDARDYGAYALSLIVATLATSVSAALACSPLVIFGLGRHGRPSRLAVETLLSTVNTAIVALVFVSAGPLLFILTREDPIVCVAGAAFVSSFTARLYTRTFAYARRRPPVAIAGDFLTISAAALVLLASWWGWGRLDLPFVFAGLASGNILAMAVELRLLRLKPRLTFRRSSLRGYGAIWQDVRWSLLGSLTTLIQSQAHSFLVAIFYGPAAFAPLAAGQVVFGPMRIMMTAWNYVMQPEIVLAVNRGDRRTVTGTLYGSSLALAGVVALLAAAFAVFWEPLSGLLYARAYADQPMAWIVGLWAAITLCTATWCAPSGVLQTFRRFRILAFGTVYGAALSTLGVALLLLTAGPMWSLVGVLAGEAFMAVYAQVRAREAVRSLRPASAAQ